MLTLLSVGSEELLNRFVEGLDLSFVLLVILLFKFDQLFEVVGQVVKVLKA